MAAFAPTVGRNDKTNFLSRDFLIEETKELFCHIWRERFAVDGIPA